MSIVVKLIFPLAISIGAIYLVLLEIVGYVRAKKQGKPLNDVTRRLFRRIFGAILIISVAFMLFWGLSKKPPTVENWEKYARYWIVVVVLVILSVLLAVWDMLDGVSNIERLVETSSRKHLKEIKSSLSKYSKKEGKRQKN